MNTVTPIKNDVGGTGNNLPNFRKIDCTDTYITVTLSDDRIISIPLWWAWRLAKASPTERANYQIIGAGYTAYWPDVDEHLSVQGFFIGIPAPRSTDRIFA